MRTPPPVMAAWFPETVLSARIKAPWVYTPPPLPPMNGPSKLGATAELSEMTLSVTVRLPARSMAIPPPYKAEFAVMVQPEMVPWP